MHEASIRSVRGDGRELLAEVPGVSGDLVHRTASGSAATAVPSLTRSLISRIAEGTVCTSSVQVCPRWVGLLDHIPVAAGEKDNGTVGWSTTFCWHGLNDINWRLFAYVAHRLQ
jgi:hypothetical protein